MLFLDVAKLNWSSSIKFYRISWAKADTGRIAFEYYWLRIIQKNQTLNPVVLLPFLFFLAEAEDAPGLILVGVVPIFGSLILAVFTAVLQRFFALNKPFTTTPN